MNPLSNNDLKAYFYHLPDELIAQQPAEPRDSAKLLVLHRKERTWEHRFFRDLPQYLDSNDLIVANNTQVIPARLFGKRMFSESQAPLKEGGKVEILLLEEIKPKI